MHRQTEIDRVGERLLRHGYPRLEMAFLVLVTGLAGFLASFALLHAGVQLMMLRYPLAVGVAFIALLLQLWLWLKLRHRGRHDLAESVDIPGGSIDLSPGDCGRGGTFDGGGASGNFDLPGGDLLSRPVEAAANAEEAAIPLFALIGIAAVALSMVLLAFSLVSTAPFLFAELLVDGAMSATLYRRLRHLPQRHWTQAVVRRTVVPFVLSAVLLAVAGFAMGMAVPGAHTFGEFLHLRGQ
jgi:FtsH-binding integral membrane protein